MIKGLLIPENEVGTLSDEEKIQIKKRLRTQNYDRLGIAALVVLIAQAFYLFYDYFRGFFIRNPLNYLNCANEIISIVFSVLFLAYRNYVLKHGIADKKNPYVIYCAYYITFILACLEYLFTDAAVRNIMHGSYIALLFITLLVPAWNIFVQFTVYGVILLFGIRLHAIYHATAFASYVAIVIVLCMTSVYFRSFFLDEIIFRYRSEVLTKRLKSQSRTDFLTGIYNRQSLYQDYKKKIVGAASIGMVMYDIDNFKMYNDSFSHIKGDECLKNTTDTVNAIVEGNGGRMYRYGGEEFVAVFFDKGKEEFEGVAKAMCSSVERLKITHAAGALLPYVTISCGACYFDRNDKKLDCILSECDMKMYQAKAQGKNRVIF